MRILQVSTADSGGGAEGSARNLFRAYRERGHISWLAVGEKRSEDPDVFELSKAPAPTASGRLLQMTAAHLRKTRCLSSGSRHLARTLEMLASQERRQARTAGREDYHFPGSQHLLDLPPGRPDVIHCHNLHGWYFDLRALAHFSQEIPVILNLRDTWLLTGHCGYFIDCDRWRNGCGDCPDLKRYPGIRRDATRENWAAKQDIFQRSRLYVTAPSEWLLGCARASMLKAEEYRLIPNGIDLRVFNPGDRLAARRRLGFPTDAKIVLFAAASRRNVYKDPETMVAGVQRLCETAHSDKLRFVCLGRRPPKVLLRQNPVQHVPFQSDPEQVADYYRAADIFIHTARAEAFGKTATEAMACGTPVVASAVGGLTEQIIHGETGYLFPPGDADALSHLALQLLNDEATRQDMGLRAAQRGAQFGLDRQVDAFLQFYEDVIRAHGGAQA